ncbi:hypothetical protein SAMN05428950_1012028 [Sphingomonas sp. OV641]|uniref:hypothetical protein n=1 Tax=Sphingomonas sp. OV641 TaxID=1881068 RepID=UPI0008CFC57F|nr:hypothetical protein [Sphingomonas sp. OV641]SEJ38034.1 hypothetical protein SAMN05428950_1012028 [Sphingomonas sp. OV641]
MLAGLIFAVRDADEPMGALAATLPFAGMTVIEYQARLLIAAGVSQIVVVVARLTPELLGAVARIGRRGVTVDTVRSAGEAAARLHPLAQLLVVADGLITTEAVVGPLAQEQGDTLLVVPEGEGDAGYELIGGGDAWAGLARLDSKRLTEVAAMPRDYDVQSSLLHVAAQAGALRLVLPEGEPRTGHGIESRRETLETRSRAVVGATLAARPGWFNRWLVRPLARAVMPWLMRRHMPTGVMAGVTAASGVAGLVALWTGQLTIGLLLGVFTTALAALAASFAWLRDEDVLARAMGGLGLGLPALSALLLGHALDAETGELTARVLALALVAAGALGHRAMRAGRPNWWGDAPAYLVVIAVGTVLGVPFLGLVCAALYATVTLAFAIETLRAPV